MDKVGDLLIRIKNGYMARQRWVEAPYSKLSMAILAVMSGEGFIESYKAEGSRIKVVLRYDGKQPALTDVRRVSKPGRRVYSQNNRLPHVLDGLGVAIISTPKGVMSDKSARKEGVGGEVMAYVW